ncbi:MAG: SDR family oxidoreductase [Planctomycetota bacterium]
MARFLITGGCGFFGTWIIRRLLDDGDDVLVFDAQRNTARWALVLSPAEIARLPFVAGKIEDTESFIETARQAAPDALIHLAGLQVPACRENPVLGARVNVLGMLNVFEAARALAGRGAAPRLVYASSAAVFGPDAEYPEAAVGDRSAPRPASHYGAFKLCNEQCAKAYWLACKLPSVGLRPLTVYGPGRDTGMTSFPTRAIAAALQKQKFDIPFSGPTAYIHVREVADIFVTCARAPAGGAQVYTVGGDIADTAAFIAQLDNVIPGARALITCSGGELPVASKLDDAALRRAYPGLLRIPLAQGIRETAEVFERHLGT